MPNIRDAVFPAVLFLAIGAHALADEPLTREQLDFFETRVRPVLIEHCYECHSQDAKKLKGGLRLDSRNATLQGGDSGPALVAGDVDGSLLIEAIRYESFEMPPRGKLPDRIVEDLEKWVAMGAPDPRAGPNANKSSQPKTASKSAAGERHWAYQPITTPPIPSVRDTSWPNADIDHFILSKLESADITPARDADRYTWLRRVTIDLTGLPPTVKDIHEFVTDDSAFADVTVVDRLLASRAFGERWAHHWLDLVGYADQIGTSNNVFAEHAWRYRDYVVDSFNGDKPFDRFIREQIAGDLLQFDTAEETAAAIVATGFLVLGDMEIVEADKAKMRVDIVDQQVVKTSKAFLGQTVGCARCHDHKFDPISQHDYYAMAGFFYSTQSVYKTDRGVWSDVIYRELPETEAQLAARTKRSDLHTQRLREWKQEQEELTAEIENLERRLKDLGPSEQESNTELASERDATRKRIGELSRKITHAEFFTPRVPRTYGVRDLRKSTNMRITIRGNPHALGEEVPRGYLKVATRFFDEPAIPTSDSGRRELANWIASPDNPLTVRVAVNRVWQKLFGNGLVSSVDYFGVRGAAPSHPELLEYLASQFVNNGWSHKTLIRSLVLSRAYRLSSEHNANAYEVDPANQLLWRMNRRRLDAEALRDSMLAISDRLQSSRGGPSLPLEFLENVGGLDPKDVNPPSFSLRRYRPEHSVQRTIYLPVIRSAAQPGPAELRNVFDFPQPAQFVGQRSTTAVPTQALFLMNSPDVKKHAERLTESVRQTATVDSDRIKLLWMRVLNRPPTPKETKEAEAFLTKTSAWDELSHALLSTNEFLMTL